MEADIVFRLVVSRVAGVDWVSVSWRLRDGGVWRWRVGYPAFLWVRDEGYL